MTLIDKQPVSEYNKTLNNVAGLKSLAKETAIYGLSSIVGRFLNYLLVPVYTMALSAQSGGYGVVTNIYAWVALLLVLLTCGMETGFFRFANKGEDDPMRVYSTTLLSVGIGALTFLALGLLFLQPVADWLEYGEHPWYVGMMMIVVAMDAIQSIPFAYLRYKKRPVKFAALKLLFIFLNIALNLIYYVWMKGDDVAYAFLFNLVCTSTIMLCMIPELRGFAYVLDRKLLKRMLAYSLPLLVLGIAGILNQVADKIIFPFVYPDQAEATVQLGIYGAASKIAMVMAMLTQAFRYAYEPFVFGKSRDKDNKQVYAQAMKFFIIFTLVAFLAVMFYLDILRYIIGRDYWPGLRVVPIVMAAEINGIRNTLFFAGDMKDMLTQDFINEYGHPDVIITDPPRAGMHQDVVDVILFAEPKRIVYVSCNPATQARDLQLLDAKYRVKAVQPVDMFPHTHHVENVVLLELKNPAEKAEE